MAEQILLSSVAFDGVRETGGFGQPLHALYPQIRAVLASELGSETADLLAEPVVDRLRNRIDWYTEGDPDQTPVALSDLSEAQSQPILQQINLRLARGQEMAERYAASGDPQRMQLAVMLKAVLSPPAAADVFLVNDRPVVVHWGFSSDRRWPAAAGVSIHSALAFSDPPSEGMPDIAIPQWEAASLHPNPAEAATPAEPLPLGPSAQAAEHAQAAPAPQPERLSEPSASAPAESPARTPDTVLAASSPLVEERKSPAVDVPETALRYVVVGSGYFWSVAVLALLLALGAVFWRMTSRDATGALENEAGSAALAEARQTEQALRRRLEERLAALTEQRRQCPAPLGAEPAPTTPATPVSATPAAPAQSLSGTPAAPAESPPNRLAPSAGLEAALAPDKQQSTQQEPTRSAGAASPVTDAGQTQQEPTRSAGAASPVTDAGQTPLATAPEVAAVPAIPTLQAALNDAQPAGAVPTAEPASAPATLAEPTPEERQEFTERLSASGAASGEVTATLFWDGHADLDLVVSCPSGQTLDYLTPQGCGGTLDVDANATREHLSNKPVENIFWPAGQVTPGTYKIAVRYAPRKDERNPQPTPFQVRLIRDGQEQVFKGTVRPQRTLPIANFTVRER